MPERIAHHLSDLGDAALFFLIGVVLSVWRTMEQGGEASRSVLIGRALSNGGLSMSAGGVLLWFPDLPLLALIGVAAVLGTLGTAGVERMVIRVVERHK